jgi:hypothetical protein
MLEVELFEELVEPVEAAAHVVVVATGFGLSIALTHPPALEPRPFFFLLALATAVSALVHTLRKVREAVQQPATERA